MHQRPPADLEDLSPATMGQLEVFGGGGGGGGIGDDDRDEGRRMPEEAVDYHGGVEDDEEDDMVTVSMAETTETTEIEQGSSMMDLLDDVFGVDEEEGEASSEPGPPETPMQQHTDNLFPPPSSLLSQAHPSDMARLQQDHATAGYRDGITAGKNTSLQAGFDEGYPLGAALGMVAGELLGLLEGIVMAEMVATDLEGRPEGTGETAGSAEATKAAGNGPTTEEVMKLLADAQQELALSSVFAQAYFAPDGTWKYGYGDEEEECVGNNKSNVDRVKDGSKEEETVFDVARAHPLIRKWRNIIDAQAAKRGIAVGEEGDILTQAVLGLEEEDKSGEKEEEQPEQGPERAPEQGLGWQRSAALSTLDW